MSDVLLLNSDGIPLSHIPLSTIPWQDAVRLVFLNKVRVLKEHKNWVIRSQYLEMKVPSVVITTEYVKWSKQLKYSRMNVYLRDDFKCQLQITNHCKSLDGKVKFSELTLDHVIPRSQGGRTTWTNVCTSCRDCNGDKGDNKLIIPKIKPYKPTYYQILAKRRVFPIQIKDEEWKSYIDWPEELIKVLPQPGAGHK